jgi:hypothetical protein
MKKIIISLLLNISAIIFLISCSEPSENQSPNAPVKKIRDYLQPSYELSNYQIWIDPNTIFESPGNLTPKNLDPTDITSSCQIDIDLDGDEDIFSFKNYNINSPSNIPPPVVYLNSEGSFFKSTWIGPNTMRGNKILVGDFNGDKRPDIFSVEGYDPPTSCNCMPEMTTNKLILKAYSLMDEI